MKIKYLLMLFTLSLLSIDVYSQWSIGGKIGSNWSNVNFPGKDPSHIPGINAGVIGNYQINDKVSFQCNLLYSTRGYKAKESAYIEEENKLKDLKVRFHYLDIPFLIKIYPISCLYLHAGPQLGIQLHRTLRYNNEKQHTALMGKKQYIDYGLISGIGWKNKKGMFIEGEYLYGFSGVYRQVDSFQNRSIQLSIGYIFKT